ncbi:MAG TPA: hypothetical protein VJT83_04945 [Chitinophagaceae bacterium]|nr:hypothetical protein [Chitinophagaceae bacterium]
MNNLQPYEKHLAKELRNVPVPDKEAGWEEMRKLLERDRPVGGGAWSGNRKWYWMGLTVLLIIGGLWGSNFTAEMQRKKASIPKVVTAKEQSPIASVSKSINNKNSTIISNKEIEKIDQRTDFKKAFAPLAVKKENQTNEFEKLSAPSAVKFYESQEVTIKYSTINYFTSISKDEIEVPVPSSESYKIIPGKTDRAFLKEARIKGMEEDNRKMSKRSMKGNFGEKEQELTFAAGLALPKTFAVGGQQALGYGINGKTSTITDYLPVPYFQYHLNDKMFLQTELHFQSPQFTDRLLIYQKQNETSPTNRVEKSIFVEKLYYFNIPFNFYYSPIKNFYIGSGIQYSSLLSGLASFEEKRYAGSTLENSKAKVLRFKDDSVARKLSPSELRYQFDANYYVKRFTLGMRYNQAMKNFVNIQPGTVLPYTQGRNKSFLLYLRYNIWEERKKNKY